MANRSRSGRREWTAASLAPTMTRPRRTCWSSRTATSASAARLSNRDAYFLQQPSRFGQGAVADRAIEQPVAELFLEAPNRLADRRLGAVELLCGHREAALGGNGDKCAQILQLHEMDYNLELFKSNKYKLDSRLEPRLQT